MVQKTALYTVQHIEEEKIHGSTDGDKTCCEIELTSDWKIINNTFDGTITCQNCLDLLNKKLYHTL